MATAPQTSDAPPIRVIHAVPQRSVGAWIALALAWLALIAVSVGLAHAGLFACGIKLFGLEASNCVVKEPLAPTRDDGVQAALRAESEHLARTLDQLRRQVAARPACPAPPAQPAPSAPKQTEAPALNEEAWKNRSVESLKGCWGLSSDYRLRDVKTNVVTSVRSWKVCFDEAGRGTQEIVLSDGAECRAPLTATFPDGETLRIDEQEDVQCSNGTRIFKRQIQCQKSSAATVNCSTYQPEGGSRSSAVLRRE